LPPLALPLIPPPINAVFLPFRDTRFAPTLLAASFPPTWGAVVLGAVEHRIGMIRKSAAAIADTHDPRYITHGQQARSFYNHHYGNYCYLPLRIFEASGALVTTVLRPGKRPTGSGNAVILNDKEFMQSSGWMRSGKRVAASF